MDDDERSKGPTPERDNVKTLPRRGLADLRKRMTDACIARVRRCSRRPPPASSFWRQRWRVCADAGRGRGTGQQTAAPC